MKHDNLGMNIMYGFLGGMMLLVGLTCVIVGIVTENGLSLALIGGIFIPVGGVLTYIGIKSFLRMKKLLAEKKAKEELEKNTPKVQPKPSVCPICGIAILATDEFCRKCGAKLK